MFKWAMDILLGNMMGPESNQWASKTSKVDEYLQHTRGKGYQTQRLSIA